MNVGRPRKTDPEQALDAAMQAFWDKGYEATSLSDLMSATGLHKGSLYQTFGDKHALFIASLKRYLEQIYQCQKEAIAAAETPLDGLLMSLFSMQDKYNDGPSAHCGCMAVNSIIELSPHDDEVRSVLDNHYQRMVGLLQQVIQNTIDAGQSSLKQPVETTCMLMMTIVAGLATMRKSFMTIDEAKGALIEQLRLLGFFVEKASVI